MKRSSKAPSPLVFSLVLACVLSLDSCAMLRSIEGLQSVFLREEDPLIAEASFPTLIKASEIILVGKPEDREANVQTASLLVMYASAFVEGDAEFLPDSRYAEKEEAKARAAALYERALRLLGPAMERRAPGALRALLPKPEDARGGQASLAFIEKLKVEDLSLAYWTAAALLARFSLDPLDFGKSASVPAAMALLDRAERLSPGWNGGAVQEILASLYASLPTYMGGDMAKAELAWNKAYEYSKGQSASLYVSRAWNFSLPADDYAGFKKNLELALAVNVEKNEDLRLATELAKRRARKLLAAAGDLFTSIPGENHQ